MLTSPSVRFEVLDAVIPVAEEVLDAVIPVAEEVLAPVGEVDEEVSDEVDEEALPPLQLGAATPSTMTMAVATWQNG